MSSDKPAPKSDSLERLKAARNRRRARSHLLRRLTYRHFLLAFTAVTIITGLMIIVVKQQSMGFSYDFGILASIVVGGTAIIDYVAWSMAHLMDWLETPFFSEKDDRSR
jgi:hypothetical protein